MELIEVDRGQEIVVAVREGVLVLLSGRIARIGRTRGLGEGGFTRGGGQEGATGMGGRMLGRCVRVSIGRYPASACLVSMCFCCSCWFLRRRITPLF